MLFFPYRLDLRLNKIPFLTILISLVCVGIYTKQYMNEQDYVQKLEWFCSKNRSHIEQMALQKSLGDASATRCLELMYELTLADNPETLIGDYAADSERFAGLTDEASREYIHGFLTDEYRSFLANVPPLTTKALWYSPASWDPIAMVTSSFSHGSWDHLIGNLLFFYAFAAAVELIVGSFAFFAVVTTMVFGTSVSYSVAMMRVEDALPTVGLSGIVMGMIAMLAYFMPTARVRCFYWFIIKIGTVAISAWILALFFIGVDVYTLLTKDDMGGINLIAHVSGAVIGFVLGVAFFRSNKRAIAVDL